ncbi:MAG: carbamoyltransferase HypF [Pseudomonadota bacterium]
MSAGLKRIRVFVRGAVQGVGFRPTVYRIASELKLAGFVSNSAQGVTFEVEGEPSAVEAFLPRLLKEKPPRASIQGMETITLDPFGYGSFEVRESTESGEKSALILPDIATCPECLSDVFERGNRRNLYPFTNCTNCGPRFTIVESLPYDRARTTMKAFPMCAECRAEYADPLNRRFHAQPNACPACGPHLELWREDGSVVSLRHEALVGAARAIREGKIVAVKGLGGFQLAVDARNSQAVARLRQRKLREEKPFALMLPSIESVREACEVSALEERLLQSPEAPIVLLRKRAEVYAASVAPRNPYLGVMLAYTPLHHVLMRELGFGIVATSGNRSDEPICTEEREALERLEEIADFYLVHNRPIARYADDSIVRVIAGRETIFRRARGFAPLPVARQEKAVPLLAVGAHLKNTMAFSAGGNIFLSHHIGDLETPQALSAFRWVVDHLPKLYDARPSAVACDLHPDYASTAYAAALGLPVIGVQHHFAHVLSCMADNDLTGGVLGVSWDGTGLGTDGTIWGGEFLRVKDGMFERVAHVRTFGLPGGDQAVREARRSALGVLYEAMGESLFGQPDLLEPLEFTPEELVSLRTMLRNRLHTPRTSSVGRLFDAFSALLGLRLHSSFEGQAAMEMEFALSQDAEDGSYPFDLTGEILDWGPMLAAIVAEHRKGMKVSSISAKFHNTLVEMIVAVAKRTGEKRLALTGGCFQNKYLTERAVRRLKEEGFEPYRHQRVPPNDGGIALGQMVAAWYTFRPQVK